MKPFRRAPDVIAKLVADKAALMAALEVTCNAVGDELNSCGVDEIKEHPVLAAHAKILAASRALLAKLKKEQ